MAPGHSTASAISKESKPSNLLIRRPHYLKDSCTLKATTERLPSIEKFPNTHKTLIVNVESENSKKKFPSDDDDNDDFKQGDIHWLKPGISLPRLKREMVRENRVRRPDTGEPFSDNDTFITSYFNKVVSPCNRLEADDGATLYSLEYREDIELEDCPGTTGPSKCHIVFRVPSYDLSFDSFREKKEKFEESLALKNWSLWLKRMKFTQESLKKKLGKNKCDLALNQLYNYRKVVQDKELIRFHNKLKEEAQRRKTPHWVHPLRNKQKKSTEKILPVEYIGQSYVTQEEKNVFIVGGDNDKPKAKRCFFNEETNKLNVHVPEVERLAIVGRKIVTQVPEKTFGSVQNIPAIYITECPKENEDPNEGRKSVFCLVINGIEIKYDIGSEVKERNYKVDDKYTWEVPFGLSMVGNLLEKVVTIENRGTIAIEYNWVLQKPVLRQSLNSFEPSRYPPWFFFDKNAGIFLPGQIYHLKFYQRAKEPGIRTETWYLKMSPPLFPNNRGAKFTLTTVVTSGCEISETESVERYLIKRMTETTVKMMLDYILDEAMKPDFGLRPIEYRALISEKTLFEYQNPKYYYHSHIVKELNQMFFEVSCSTQTEWDLSLATLLNRIQSCIAEKRRREFLMTKISQMGKIILNPPRVISRERNKKFKMIHQILCKMANLIDSDYDYQERCILLNSPRMKTGRCFDELIQERQSGSLRTRIQHDSKITIQSEVRAGSIVRFHMMLYLKVYERLSEAVEAIVGILETSKNLESWEADTK